MKDKHPNKGKKKGHENIFHSRRCVICNQPFNRMESICHRCGSCQNCEWLNPDKFGNTCIHCLNTIDQPRYNTTGPIIITHQNHGRTI